MSTSASTWEATACWSAAERSTSASVRAISPWFRSKMRRGMLTPNPNVLSGPIRSYWAWGVTSHHAFARARFTSAWALA